MRNEGWSHSLGVVPAQGNTKPPAVQTNSDGDYGSPRTRGRQETELMPILLEDEGHAGEAQRIANRERRPLRLGRARAGGSRPSADLHRSGRLVRGDDEHLRAGLGLSRTRGPDPVRGRLSRLHLRHAQPRGPFAHRLPRRHHQADRRMARPAAEGTNSGLRGEPTQIQRQLEARLRQFRRRVPRGVLAPLALGNGEPPGRRRQQGHVLLQGLAGHGADAHRVYGQRPSLQGQAAEHPEARRRFVGGGRPRAGRRALRRRAAPALRRQSGRNPRPPVLGAGQHQRVSKLLAARQPYPRARAGLGRRDQRHLVRHRSGRRGQRAGRSRRRDQRATHAHAGAIPEFWRSRRPRQFRGNPARARVPRGRVDLHASRARHSRAREDGRKRHHHGARHRRGVHARIHQGMEPADEGDAEARGSARAVGANMQTIDHPTISSYYVNDELYRNLVENFSDWQRDELAIAAPEVRDRFRLLLEREARLLDELRFDEWLAMYSPECIYWVPGTPEGGDPRREIAVSFDDRRRMEDRIYRLRTGYAWSQAPKSRTVRMISNVEVFATSESAFRMVRSNFLISEFRVDGTRFLSGWCGHRFVERAGRWEIQVRQVNLIDCDPNLRNPSIVL